MAKPSMVSLRVDGPCVPKARPRVYQGRDGKAHTITPARTREWEATVRQHVSLAWRQEPDAEHRFAIYLVFSIAHAPRWNDADADNYAKAVLDAMNGIVYRDDVQVCTLTVHKEQPATEEYVNILIVRKEELWKAPASTPSSTTPPTRHSQSVRRSGGLSPTAGQLVSIQAASSERSRRS